jgi:hypothetical protein
MSQLTNDSPIHFTALGAFDILHYLSPNFSFRYFDQSVLTFMQKFKQNGLLDNINFSFDKLSSKDILPTVLCHLLPLVNSIISIKVSESVQLVEFYDSGNSKEIYEMNMKMMEQTQFLSVR